MPAPAPSHEIMASLTTSLLDKNGNQHHFLELQASSQHDEEKNGGKHDFNSQQQMSSSSSLINWRRRMHQYFMTKLGTTLPMSAATTTTISSCKSSLSRRQRLLAFFSHFCFILASSLYVQLSFVNRNWILVARDQYHVPKNVFVADDDIAWRNWETSSSPSSSSASSTITATFHSGNIHTNVNNNITDNGVIIINNDNIIMKDNNNNDDDIGYDPILESIRNNYNLQSTSLQIYASLFFVMVGIFDWMRYRDTMNVFMICAGGAGMASGMAQTSSMESVWNCVSVHIYLLEAYNLSHRQQRTTTGHHHPHHRVNNDSNHDDDDDHAGDENDVAHGSNNVVKQDHPGENKYLFLKVGNTCFLVGCILDVSSPVLFSLDAVLWDCWLNDYFIHIHRFSDRTSTWPVRRGYG